MTYGNTRSGLNNVGEYQASGLPWVTSSAITATPVRIDFPYVTNNIYFMTTGSVGLRVGFTVNGINGGNYVPVTSGGGWVEFNVRTSYVYLRSDAGSATYSMMAGLTMIENKQFPNLTGSATYNSASIGNSYGYGKPGDPGAGTGLG